MGRRSTTTSFEHHGKEALARKVPVLGPLSFPGSLHPLMEEMRNQWGRLCMYREGLQAETEVKERLAFVKSSP